MTLNRYTVLTASTLVLLLTSVAMTSSSLFLPFLEAEFGWNRSQVTVPFTVATLVWGLGAPFLGKLADDFGARRLILSGVALMAAGFLGAGLAQNLWHLSLSLGVMVGLAMGACGISIAALLVSQHFEAGQRGLAVSVLQSAPPLNPLLFAPLLFFVMTASSWRTAAFMISAALAVIALPLAWLGSREPPGAGRLRTAPVSWAACLGPMARQPLLSLLIARFACGTAFFQMAHLVAIAMSKGFTAATGATAVSVFGGSAVVFSLLSGWAADRIGRGRALGLTYFIRGLGTVGMALFADNQLLFYALAGIGMGPTMGSIAVNNVMVYETVGPRMAGAALGLGFIVHQVGSALGLLLVGSVFDRTGSYDLLQTIMGSLLFAAGLVTYNIGRQRGALPAGLPALTRGGEG